MRDYSTHFRCCSFALARRIITVALFVIFVYQTVTSFEKYFARNTTNIYRTLTLKQQEFPSLSFCPMGRSIEKMEVRNSTTGAETFQDALKAMDRPDFLLYYQHGAHGGRWSQTVAVHPMTEKLLACATYTTPDRYSTGYDSSLFLYAKLKKSDQGVVYVHGKGQNVLQPTTLHGKDFIGLAGLPPGIKSRFAIYEISVHMKKVLSRKELACHRESNPGVHDCIREHFESTAGCILPWRAPDGASPESVCSDASALRQFKDVHSIYKSGTEQEVYELTRCHFGCLHEAYQLKNTAEELYDYPIDAFERYDQFVHFYLGASGVLYEEEVLVFDFLDLVGNVGGFLGLLLGASLLSLFDKAKEIADKMR